MSFHRDDYISPINILQQFFVGKKMPAKSESQRNLMRMVYAYKKGSLKLNKLPKSLAKKIRTVAKDIPLASAKDFMEGCVTLTGWLEVINEKSSQND